MKYHKIPQRDGSRKLKSVYSGKRTNAGQYYLVRNCDFEPSQMRDDYKSVENCINHIKQSFFWKKPAIIASHRLNYIGGLIPENSERNLGFLDKLLGKIIEIWPDVEFMSSDQLVELIINNK